MCVLDRNQPRWIDFVCISNSSTIFVGYGNTDDVAIAAADNDDYEDHDVDNEIMPEIQKKKNSAPFQSRMQRVTVNAKTELNSDNRIANHVVGLQEKIRIKPQYWKRQNVESFFAFKMMKKMKECKHKF